MQFDILPTGTGTITVIKAANEAHVRAWIECQPTVGEHTVEAREVPHPSPHVILDDTGHETFRSW